MVDKLVRLKALRVTWMGDHNPMVERGDEFETDQATAKILVVKGWAEVVKVKPQRTRKPKEAKE